MRKWLPLIVICTGTFMLLVDVTIVNVALPNQAAGQRRDREDGQPGEKRPAVPHLIGDRTDAEHERGQDQRVGVHHPLQ